MSFGDLKVQDLIYEDSSNNEITVVIADLATKANPTFTGTVTVPTANANDNTTKAASTAYVQTELGDYLTTATASSTYAPKAAPAFTGTATGVNLTLSGDLTVNGTTTTINTTTLQVEDKNIEIGKVSTPSDATADGGGLTLLGASNKTWNWVNSTDAWTSSEHIHLGDNKKLLVGTGSDLQLWHDGTNSRIAGSTGATMLYSTNDDVYIEGADDVFIQVQGGETALRAFGNGQVELWYDNNLKFATSNTGCTVTGTLAATAVTGDGSGLTNLPPGGNSVELVADGAIAAGKAVILKTNGKAEQVKETQTLLSPPTRDPAFSSAGTAFNHHGNAVIVSKQTGVAWSETTKVGSIVFSDNTDSGHLKTRGFRLSTTFGYDGNYYQPNAQRELTGYRCNDSAVAWDSTNNKFCYVYQKDSDNATYFRFATPDTSNVAYITDPGSELTINSASSYFPKICDAASGRIATCVYSSSGTSVRMFSWNGSSAYTQGGSASVTSASSDFHDVCYHKTAGKLVAVYRDQDDSNKGKCKIGTISGSGATLTTSWGSEATFETEACQGMKVAVDENSGSVLIVHLRSSGANSNYYHLVAGTISGTGISFGTPTRIVAITPFSGNQNIAPPAITYVPGLQKCAVSIIVNNGGANQRIYTPSTSGTSITVGGDTDLMQIHSGTENYLRYQDMVAITKPDGSSDPETQLILVGKNEHDSNKGVMRRLKYTSAVTNLTGNHQNFLGFAEDAISDGATGTIKLSGNIVGNQSGLTPATWYYVTNDGTLTSGGSTYLAGGMAVAADKLRIKDLPKN